MNPEVEVGVFVNGGRVPFLCSYPAQGTEMVVRATVPEEPNEVALRSCTKLAERCLDDNRSKVGME